MNRIPVAFTVDANYLPYLKATIRSLLINAVTSPVEVLICHYDISKRAQDEFIVDLTRSMELGAHRVRFVSFKNVVDNGSFKSIGTTGYLTQCASYRLAIPDVFVEYERMIYLDSDLLVVDDIFNIFNIDLRGCWLGAVRGLGYPDFYDERPERQKWCAEHGLSDVYSYFNSGVLLYDLKAMREHAPLEKLVAAGCDSSDFPDQDGLNIACQGHVRLLPEIWNVTIGFAFKYQPQLLEDAAILHFATGQKPWNDRSVLLAELWWQYRDAPANEIPCRGQAPQGTLIVNGWLKASADGLKPRNWGDDVNYHLLSALAGERPVMCLNKEGSGAYDIDLLFIGSTLHLATANSMVWGAGVLSEKHLPKVQPREIRAVRGPLTRDLLCQAGMACPEVYGDPALLLPLVYNSATDKRYDVCFVTHFVDAGLSHVKDFCAAHPEICWVDMGNYGDWHSVIDKICASKLVISSSLHGLIVADAYGVPNVWVELSDQVVGGGFKFHDYFRGVGRRDVEPLDFRNTIDLEWAQSEAAKWTPVEFDVEEFMSVSPLADEVFSAPLVSVVIPVYNVEQYLDECMASVLGQTYKNLEVICVDDGSTDGSLSKLRDYAMKDRRVKVIAQTNHGAAVARNHALDVAQGEWVVFMDPDDYYPGKGTINRMLKAAIAHGADICGGSLQLIDVDGKLLNRSHSGDNFGYFFDRDGVVDYRDYQFDYCYVRFIYRRRLLEEHKLRFPDLRRFEDPVFMVKAFAAAGRFYALRESTYVYRAGNGFAKVDWAAKDCFMARQMLEGMRMVIEIAEAQGFKNLLARRARNLIQGAGEVFWRADVQPLLGDALYLLAGKYVRMSLNQPKVLSSRISEHGLQELRTSLEKTRSDRDAKSAQLKEFREALGRARADRDAKSAQLNEFREALGRSRADRDAKSQQIQELRASLEKSRADRDAKSAQLKECREALDRSRADRDAKSQQLQELRASLEKSRSDRDAKSAQLKEAREALDRARVDRDAKSQQVQELRASLEKSRSDRDVKSVQLKEFREALDRARADRDAKSQQVQELRVSLEKTRSDYDAKSLQVQELRASLEKSRSDRDAKSLQVQELRAALEKTRADRDSKSLLVREFRVACKAAKETVIQVRGQRDELERKLKDIAAAVI